MGDANIIPQKQKQTNKSNQTMAVKHCQSFQISVTHQNHLKAHNHQHRPSRPKLIKKPCYRNQSKEKVVTGCL